MQKNINPIYVTQPALPPLEDFIESLRKIWETKILTNNGPFHQQFEKELADYLGVKYLSLFANGTMALVTALQAMNISGEVITTPFSFVATTHALWWNNIKPVFVDIEPDFFTLDPGKIEAAITEHTKAIMPVHVYGNLCDIDELQRIAEKYKLIIIYDAAHAFGVKKSGNSILNYGDLSIMSFHATKSFNTIEGGAIVCHDEKTKKRIDYLKNFGFADEVTIIEPGINAKMNELQAAYGLLQLNYINEYTEKRKIIAQSYRRKLSAIEGITFLDDVKDVNPSYAYFPIMVDSSKYKRTRDELYEVLKLHNIFSRRYFYPLISQFSPYSNLPSAKPENLPVATRVAEQILCLPIYPLLKENELDLICQIIQKR